MTDPVAETRAWVERFVVGEGLCPWARPSLDTLRVVSTEADPDALLEAVLVEGDRLLDAPTDRFHTTLLVVPEGLEAFEDLLDAQAAAEDALVLAGMSTRLQLVAFHPDLVFPDEDPDDPAQFTNRSPWPTLHLLREDDVAAAVAGQDGLGRSVPERNGRHLRALGWEAVIRRARVGVSRS